MFLLRTFGALEFVDAAGAPIAGAAGQRRPLLILALAGLVPGGIPRERLLAVLWPNADRDRARATLKQHLYALRRATGSASLLAGAPRLRVAADLVRIDVLELVDHVEHGQMGAAAALLQGELLEDVLATAGEPLRDLILEIRDTYAAPIALARRAQVAQRTIAAPVSAFAGRVAATIGAERELRAAARRFTRGLATIADAPIAAYHRAGHCSHDLLEAMSSAEQLGVPGDVIRELISEAEPVWRRSQLVEQMLIAPPGQPGSAETMEWLLEGGVRTSDRVGRALESQLIDSGVAAQLRSGPQWEWQQLRRRAGDAEAPFNVLMLAPRGAGQIASVLPWLERCPAQVTVSDGDPDGLARLQQQFADCCIPLTAVAGDAVDRVDELASAAPFDIILSGGLLDQLAGRTASWLIEQLGRMLSPGGLLCLTSLASHTPHGPWLRHVVRWNPIERDQEDLLLLAGAAASECEALWDQDILRHTWRLSLCKTPARPRVRAAA